MKPLLTSPKGKGLQSAYTSADICYNDVNSLAAENSPHLTSPVGEGTQKPPPNLPLKGEGLGYFGL